MSMSKREGEKQSDLWIPTTELARSPGHPFYERLNKILAERTGQALEKIQRDTDRDYFLEAEEAKAYGLVDQVIAKRP